MCVGGCTERQTVIGGLKQGFTGSQTRGERVLLFMHFQQNIYQQILHCYILVWVNAMPLAFHSFDTASVFDTFGTMILRFVL